MKLAQKGVVVSIGGREDKEDEKIILREVARRLGKGKLVVSAVASNDPEPLYDLYDRAFGNLGVDNIEHLEVAHRNEASDPKRYQVLDNADAVFFTGGDQLRITSQIGGTPVFEKIKAVYDRGGMICGTSAGASVVCSTMLITGSNQESLKIGDVQIGPGLGFLDWAIIDQHFAERGRIGRLLGAIAENPLTLGIGIDEDTAIVVEGSEGFYVLGDGAVTVVDGHSISYSNISEAMPRATVSIYDVKIHVLSAGDGFRLSDRRPYKYKHTAR